MELHEISGIGPARARWLEESLHVRTLHDLAALSPQEVERRLKRAGGNKPPRSTIEAWIAEAQKHLAEEEPKVEPSVPGRPKSRRKETWKPVASFVVEFQSRAGSEASEPPAARWRTAAHHVEEDRDEAWPGWDFGALGGWMAGQLPTGPGSGAAEEIVRVEDADAHERPGPGEVRAIPLAAHLIDGDGLTDSNLVRIDEPWTVIFTWPPGEPVDPSAGGEWWLDLLLTPVGASAPLRVSEGSIRLPATDPGLGRDCRYRHVVPVGTVTRDHTDRVYRASATVLFVSGATDRAIRSGSTQLGIVRFYEPSGSGDVMLQAAVHPA
jgi:hypothetical protein